MSDTFEKQRRFAQSVLTNELDEALFVSCSNLQSRLDVYRHTYMQSLVELLQTKFPVTAKYLGEDFHSIAVAYTCKNPPQQSGQFALYGDTLSSSLDSPEASAIAQLEWSIQKVERAKEESMPELGGCDPENIKWVRRADIDILALEFDVLPTYNALKLSMPWVNPDPQPSFYSVYKLRDSLAIHPISHEAYQVLSLLSKPSTIPELQDKLTFSQDILAKIFTEVFQHAFVKGLHEVCPKNSGDL